MTCYAWFMRDFSIEIIAHGCCLGQFRPCHLVDCHSAGRCSVWQEGVSERPQATACESWKQVIQYEHSIVSEYSGLPCLVFQSNREVVYRICRSSRPMLGEHVHTSLACIPWCLPQNTGSTLCDCQMITKTKHKTMNIRSSCTWRICLRQYATKLRNDTLLFCHSAIHISCYIIL